MKYLYAFLYILCLAIPILLIVCGVWFGLRKLFQRVKYRPNRWLQCLLLLYPICWVLLLLLQRFAPQHEGFFAITHIFLPHLFVPLILLVPFIFLPRTITLRIALTSCTALFVLLFLLPVQHAIPRSATTEPTISILNWNVQRTELLDQRRRTRSFLLDKPADVIVLEETYWQWLRADSDITAIYPHQFVHSTHSESGLVLLTSYPVSDYGVSDLAQTGQGWARFLWVRLTVGQQPLLILALHPEAPFGTSRSCQFIPCFNSTNRDKLFTHARTIIDSALRENAAIVVVGDLNVTEREAVYPFLTNGLQDTQSLIGSGFGSTWGLIPQLGLSIPVLRTDHMLVSPAVIPVQFITDCQLRGSDHCIIKGVFAL